MQLSFPEPVAFSAAAIVILARTSMILDRARIHRKAKYRRRIRERARCQQEQTKREWDEPTNNTDINKIVFAINGIAKKIEGAEDKEYADNNREFFWKAFEVSGLWAAAGVGAIAIIVGSRDADNQFKVSQETFVQTSRAWVTVEPEMKTAGINWIKSEMFFSITLDIANIGNSPAMEAWGFVNFVLPENTIVPLVDKAKKACNEDTKAGVLLFPDKKSIPVPTGKGMSSQDVIDWFTDVRRVYHQDFAPSLPMDLVVCVKYRIIGDKLLHHTGRTFTVVDKNSVEPRLGVNILAGEMGLRPDPHGHYAD